MTDAQAEPTSTDGPEGDALNVGVTLEAGADVIRAADIAAASELGFDVNAMLAAGQDVSGVLAAVRQGQGQQVKAANMPGSR